MDFLITNLLQIKGIFIKSWSLILYVVVVIINILFYIFYVADVIVIYYHNYPVNKLSWWLSGVPEGAWRSGGTRHQIIYIRLLI
jgi:hypothetical protein